MAKTSKKSTTKAKLKPKSSAGKGPAKAVAAKKSVAAAKPAPTPTTTPRTALPPKSKTALTQTDKRVVEGVRPTNGKARIKTASGRPMPRVSPAPATPEVIMPVPKPGKNAAGLSAKELDYFRELLLAKRRELVGDMYSMEREALQRSGENLSNLPMHMADMGTDNYEQEFTLGLMEKDRQLLREINAALVKIQNGMYGICEGTGKVISKARLEVQPWAKYSIEHARKLEDRKFVRF